MSTVCLIKSLMKSERTTIRRVTHQDLLRSPRHFLAFGLGAGLSPKAPGTAGTLVAIPFILAFAQSTALYATITLICVVAGITICGTAAKTLTSSSQPPDHPAIVWDEITGMLLTMAFIPIYATTLVVGFILFRVFDICKPWPIGYLDRHVSGGFGIMLDDIVAAIFANIILRILLPYLPPYLSF